MYGLIIKKEWLDLIISGKKTLEIRGSDTKKVGQSIYLLESGSSRVRAICKINNSTELTYQNWNSNKDKACLTMTFEELTNWYKKPYAWEITDVEPIEDIWYYNHPKGAVIWVKDVEPIDEMQNDRIRYGY